ncbi:MAG TPA: hypothetical protein VHC39_14965 [Rhizomicrobium sp.]|nr:hypothetical protein [Rhizomicrobium sp.]
MVIVFPDNKRAVPRSRAAEHPSFLQALLLAMALSAIMWCGLLALARL